MNKLLKKWQLGVLIFLLFNSCVSLKNDSSIANVEKTQLIAKIEAYISEVDSLINCRDCDARITEFHSSLVGSSRRKILGIRFPTLYGGGGGSSDYSLYVNCPDSLSGIELWDCDTKLIYSWLALAQQHKITRRRKNMAIYTYYENEKKVAERIWYDNSKIWLPKEIITYYQEDKVIYRNKERKQRNYNPNYK